MPTDPNPKVWEPTFGEFVDLIGVELSLFNTTFLLYLVPKKCLKNIYEKKRIRK